METGYLPVIGFKLNPVHVDLTVSCWQACPVGLPAQRCNCTSFAAQESMPHTAGGFQHYQTEQVKLWSRPFVDASWLDSKAVVTRKQFKKLTWFAT